MRLYDPKPELQVKDVKEEPAKPLLANTGSIPRALLGDLAFE